MLSNRLNQETAALARLDANRRKFLYLAVGQLVRCLWVGGARNDEHMFRLCAYWLQNTGDEQVTEHLDNGWSSIASARFLPLVYQLAARCVLPCILFEKWLH